MTAFEPLGQDFVQWHLQRAAAAGLAVPSLQAAVAGFRSVGSRPEVLAKVLQQLQTEAPADVDKAFADLCADAHL